VALFDEVEKAHQRVFDVLLQVLEEGRLTDSQGNTALFSETVVIMTSNLGSPHMMAPLIGERERDLVMAEVHRFFRPEFLNRIDEVVMFHQLTGDHLAKILDLMLGTEIKLAKEQGIELALTPGAKTWLLAQNDEPQFGARPLRRLIARHLREPLADYLLAQERKEGGGTAVIIVDAGDKSLKFQMA
jgi:ATP-dependent Clp protease ATP-binding subunit ClpB